jgi:hypothetical protein
MSSSNKLLPKKSLDTQYIFEQLYDTIQDIVGNKKITTKDVMTLTINLMKFIEVYPDIHGKQKKVIIIRVLKRFVEDNMTGDSKDNVLNFIKYFLPEVIDSLISVDKKEVIIKIKKGLKKCFPCF